MNGSQSEFENTGSSDLYGKAVGDLIYTNIIINGTKLKGIVDSGSQISSISESSYKYYFPTVNLVRNSEFINVESASEGSVQFIGYIIVRVAIFNYEVGSRAILVTRDPVSETARTLRNNCPILVGTNILDTILESSVLFEESGNININKLLHDRKKYLQWSNNVYNRDVKLWIKKVCIEPGQSAIVKVKTPRGFKNGCYEALIEPANYVCEGTVAPITSLVTVNCGTAYIKLQNFGNCNVTLQKGAICGSLSTIKGDDTPIDDEEVEFQEYVPTNINSDEKERFIECLEKHRNIFAKNEFDVGETNLMEHKIHLTSNVPVKQPYRRVPPGILKEVRELLRGMEKRGIIRPSCSPFASQMVLVRKSNGKLRICIDYRGLNKITIADAFPTPRIVEMIDTLKGAKYFSKIDLASGYHQIPLAEEDKHKTAFNTPFAHYEWNRVPMGLRTSAACFSRLLATIFRDDMFEQIVSYFDDILVYTKTFDEHITKLDNVFTKLGNGGLKIRIEKCGFFQEQITYLGHLLNEEGVSVDPDKITRVQNWKIPKNLKDLKSFIGFASYYRRFVKNFAQICSPLHKVVTNKDKGNKRSNSRVDITQEWAAECNEAFDKLKYILCSEPILAYVDFQNPFYLEIDASKAGLGAILSQKDDKCTLHPVAYASRSLRKSERENKHFSAKGI